MKRAIKSIVFVSIFFGCIAATTGADDIKFKTDPLQRVDAEFRLFATENIWTYLLLDTRNGRIWQVNYSVDANGVRGKFPINLKSLVDPSGEKAGRFTLYPTQNLWTFLLLDQDDGRVWQCQYSMSSMGKFLLPLDDIDAAKVDQQLKPQKAAGQTETKQ